MPFSTLMRSGAPARRGADQFQLGRRELRRQGRAGGKAGLQIDNWTTCILLTNVAVAVNVQLT
eukprot:755796-Hanusia_phi.AAC.5